MNAKKIMLLAVRSLLGLVFLFSGFTKAVDPWGLAIKLGEYFHSFSMDWLDGASFFFAVALPAVEMTLGLMLMCGVWKRVSSLLVLAFMLFFTLLTFYIALENPVADCGCFGDAVKLTNWQTFFKNAAVLLPMSLWVWWEYRKAECDGRTLRNGLLTGAFLAASAAVGCYCLWTLPLIDFLPYKIGINISESKQDVVHSDVETTLIYKDKLSGAEQEFELSDTTWYDTVRWEYVDTRIVMDNKFMQPSITDFAILDSYGTDVSDDILSHEDVVVVCVSDINAIPEKCKKKLGAYLRALPEDTEIIAVTPSSLAQGQMFGIDGREVAMHNIDATTLKTVLRARNGIVRLNAGTITDKQNCNTLSQ